MPALTIDLGNDNARALRILDGYLTGLRENISGMSVQEKVTLAKLKLIEHMKQHVFNSEYDTLRETHRAAEEAARQDVEDIPID
jgi:hypothetical protein